MKRGDKYSILNATWANAGRILSEIALYLLKPTVIALFNGRSKARRRGGSKGVNFF